MNTAAEHLAFPPEVVRTMRAMRRLRAASGVPYGSRVDRGRLRLVVVTYNRKGTSTVTEKSAWMTGPALLALVESMAEAAEAARNVE